MKTVLILNAAAGAQQRANMVRTLLPLVGIDADVWTAQRGEEVYRLAGQALRQGYELIAAGGGDGTISTVAQRLVGKPATLGVLPLGTLNHFAKDLHIPLDLSEALRVLRHGQPRCIDVGAVNGRYFLNNSSLGLYPHLVRVRERHQRHGLRKWNAFFWAALSVLRRYPKLHVSLKIDGMLLKTTTPLVFIGNNFYEMNGLRVGSRAALDHGELCLCYTPHAGPWRLLRISAQALLGKLHRMPDFEMLRTKEVCIETQRRLVRVATDGEVHWMRSPLQYCVQPKALRVMTPRREAAQ